MPSFHFVSGATNMVIDPNHGQTLVNDLASTVGAGDKITLVEGFTDWSENAALWRTENAPYATTQRDYPSQGINILLRYSTQPFPATLTVQAETADSVHTTATSNPWNIYRPDLGVQTTTDTDGGWTSGTSPRASGSSGTRSRCRALRTSRCASQPRSPARSCSSPSTA